MYVVGIEQHRPAELEVGGEARDLFAARFVLADEDERDAVAEFLAQLDQNRQRFVTRPTPGREEIHDDDVLGRRHRHGRARELRQLLRGEWFADEDPGCEKDRDHPIWIHVAIWKNKYSRIRSCGMKGAVGELMSGTV